MNKTQKLFLLEQVQKAIDEQKSEIDWANRYMADASKSMDKNIKRKETAMARLVELEDLFNELK